MLASCPPAARISVFGPFQSIAQKNERQFHLVITGPLGELTNLTKGLNADRVDLSPRDIL
jgi:hypothetical protein